MAKATKELTKDYEFDDDDFDDDDAEGEDDSEEESDEPEGDSEEEEATDDEESGEDSDEALEEDDDEPSPEGDPARNPSETQRGSGKGEKPTEEQDYTFKADGRNWSIPGARRIKEPREVAGGLFIPDNILPDLEQLLSEGKSHQGSGRRAMHAQREEIKGLKAQLEERNTYVSTAESEAKETLKFFADLMAQGPEAVAKWLDKFDENKVTLENELLRKQLERQGKPERRAAEEESDAEEIGYEVSDDRLMQSLEQNVRRLRTTEFPELSDEDVQELLTLGKDQLNRLFIVAPESIPEHDVLEGDVLIDMHYLRSLIRPIAAVVKRNSKSTKEAREAMERNRKRLRPKGASTIRRTGMSDGTGGKPNKRGRLETAAAKRDGDRVRSLLKNTPIEELVDFDDDD